MTTAWVYRRTEPRLWTVGHYTPSGEWEPESDHSSADEAAARLHHLNGGTDTINLAVDQDCPNCGHPEMYAQADRRALTAAPFIRGCRKCGHRQLVSPDGTVNDAQWQWGTVDDDGQNYPHDSEQSARTEARHYGWSVRRRLIGDWQEA